MIKVTFFSFKSFSIYTLSPLVHARRGTVFIVKFGCFFEIWKTDLVVLLSCKHQFEDKAEICETVLGAKHHVYLSLNMKNEAKRNKKRYDETTFIVAVHLRRWTYSFLNNRSLTLLARIWKLSCFFSVN